MKKLLLLFILLLSFSKTFAQLDTEHWFGPMMDRAAQSNPSQTVYVSTDQTTPFKVEIYSNNALIGSVMVSKGNPQKFPIPRNYIITTFQSDLFTPTNKGLYLRGDKKFFANLRFSVNQHAEIVTSKGTAGKGKEFYATPAPIASNLANVGFMTSILATANNTQVTINGFNPAVRFSDNVIRTQFNITLQKGQSYIIDGRSNISGNWTGFIGAKITSTEPIIVTNGNFNGQYVPTSESSTDILMDQSVPTDKLGTEFALVKGNGVPYPTTSSNYSQNMEKAFIVAAVNGSNIYVNNETTPVNPTPLNAGQHFVVSSDKYVNQGNGQYNMFVRTTENAYVFQLLAGTDGTGGTNQIATGGYNYIPPLSCYLPKEIEELGFISENEGYRGGFPYTDTPTKLNIITEKGATVTIQRNGVNFPITAVDGPYNLSGTNNWVTYSISRTNTSGSNSVTGNMTVKSTKAVTAGISAGDGAVGYGGYFAGFSSIPLIVKSGPPCLNLGPVFLEITPGFNNYQWYQRDLAGNATPIAGATSNVYQVTQAGIYFAELQQGSCPPVTTQDYKFFNCDTYTNYDYTSCGSEIITPVFTLSTQTVNPASVTITTLPTKGTAVVDNTTGKITYTANANASGTDTFKYKFTGNGAIPDTEEVQITVIMIEWKAARLEECSTNGTATYNLSTANVTSDTSLSKTYFTTQNGAQNNIAADRINNFTGYTTTDTTVYVRLVRGSCFAVAPIVLKSKLAPDVKENLYTKLHCDEEIDGKIDGNYQVILSNITPIVMPVASNFIVSYYTDAALTNLITGTYTFTGNTTIYIKVEAPNGCPTVSKPIQLKIGTPFAINSPVTVPICDNDLNNSEQITLSNYVNFFTTDTTGSQLFYDTLLKAQNGAPGTNITTATITGDKTFYYRFKRPNACDAIGVLNVVFKQSTPSTSLPPTATVCEGGAASLDVGTGYAAPGSILWSTGSTSQTISLPAGNYWVDLTNASGCTYRQTITVIDSPKPILDVTKYNASICDTNLDGTSDKVNLNSISPIIVTNYAANPGLFTVKYYLNQGDATAGNANTIPNPTNFTFTAATTVYVRVESPHCPPIFGQINFQFGTPLPLIAQTVNKGECDSDVNGSIDIKLSDYRSLFTTDTAATVRYFASLTDAQNNTPTIPINQTITGDTTFYFRYKKAGFCDVIGTLNIKFNVATPTALLDSYTVCEGGSISLTVTEPYSAWSWKKGGVELFNGPNAILNAGVYTVSFTNAAGCVFTKTLTIVDSPKAILDLTKYNSVLCDSDFDGNSDPVNFNNITPIIVTNFAANPGLYTVKYYLNPANPNNTIPNLTNWTFSANTIVYVRIESPDCPPITGQINFQFGNPVPLIAPTVNVSECDNDLNGSIDIKLANYRSLFTTDGAATVRYFTTLQEAQSNTPTTAANQPITEDKTFYYRFKKAGFCDIIGTLNIKFNQATPTALLDSYTICQGETQELQAEENPIYKAWSWKKGNTVLFTTSKVNLPAGVYTVSFTNATDCVFTKTITILESPKAMINMAAFNPVLCDDNFDGQSNPVNFTIDVTPKIVTNFNANPGLFNVRYYLNANDRDLGNSNTIPNIWTFSTDTTVYVRIESQYCTFVKEQINFKFGARVPLDTNPVSTFICDSDLSGSEQINLTTFKTLFTTLSGVSVRYFDDLLKAQTGNPSDEIPTNPTIDGDKVYYLRFAKVGFCDEIGTLNIDFRQPIKSTKLVDQKICPEATTTLDAGTGFDYYKWSTGQEGATLSSISGVGVGEYWVDLTSNGCVYRQTVTVTAFELPEITGIEIKGTTVTVTVTGGTPPYQYAMDNQNYQSSNVFTNVSGGDHTVYVISADDCAPVSKDLNLIRMYNTITPNGDGINDVFDYSDLMKKDEPFMQIFDRQGRLIFTGNNTNQFIWDGRSAGKLLPTGSYWFVVHWKEPGLQTLSQYNGWVLVKNRD